MVRKKVNLKMMFINPKIKIKRFSGENPKTVIFLIRHNTERLEVHSHAGN